MKLSLAGSLGAVASNAGRDTLRRVSTAGALAGLSLSVLMPSLDTGIANAGLTTLARVLGASFQQVQWIVLSYLLSVTTLIVGAGRLGDVFGRRRLLVAGVLVFTLSSLACAASPTLTTLLAARFVQGLGAALMAALALALVGGTVSKARAGSAIGLLGTMSAMGTALGPSLGGLLMERFGWRSVFLINVPLGLVTLILISRNVPADFARNGRRSAFDLKGMLLLAFALGSYALAMTTGHGEFGTVNGELLLLAGLSLSLFVIVESRTVSPLVHMTTLADPVLAPGIAMSLLVSTVMMTTLVVGPFYLGRSLGLAVAHAGLALSVGPLVAALIGLLGGPLADRFGTTWMTRAGLAAMVTGAWIQSLLPEQFGVMGYLLPLAVMTSGYALFQTANNAAIMAAAPEDERGGIAGTLGLARNLGLITGTAAMGAVFAFATSTRDVTTASPDSIAAAMRFTFGVTAALAVLALGIAMGRKASRRDRSDVTDKDRPMPSPKPRNIRLGGGSR